MAKKNEESYHRCSKCGRYSPKEKCRFEREEKIHKDVKLFPDCAYGDDDMLADVTYFVEYIVCPFCGGLTKFKETMMHAEHHRRL